MEQSKYYFNKRRGNSMEVLRAQRLQTLNRAREETRGGILNLRRNIEENKKVVKVDKQAQRAAMLAKWKCDRERALAEVKRAQKPVFKVGIVQRKVTGSPLLKMTKSYATKNFLNPDQLLKVNKVSRIPQNGMTTRAKSRAITVNNQSNVKKDSAFVQIINNKKKHIKNHSFKVPQAVAELTKSIKVTVPQSPQVLRRKKNAIISAKDKIESKRNDIGNDDVKVISSEAESGSPKPVSANDFVPIHYSPFVCKARGSSISSPKTVKGNLSLNVDELIEKEENESKCRIFSFRKYIECQTKQLLDACNFWKTLTTNNENISNDIHEEVLSVCGKVKLLTTDKFMQFKDLIDKCENKDPMIKVEDLQGYQDWVAIEVDALDRAFAKLEERRRNNWKETNELVVCKPQKEKKEVQVKKVKKSTTVRSNIREHILAARKLKQSGKDLDSFGTLETWMEAKSPARTPKNENILMTGSGNKSLSKTRKSHLELGCLALEGSKRFSGLEIIAATQIAKSITPSKALMKKLDEPISSHNELLTPLKSILKQAPSSVNSSKHSVQFKLSSRSLNKGRGLSEKYFEPLMDEDDCSDIFAKVEDLSLHSPTSPRQKKYSGTPVRRSARLAGK